MTEKNIEEQTTEVQTEDKQSAQGAELNISDLLAIRNIIEIASQRGSFKAAELEVVGKTFNRLNNFLESVSKKEA
jgi:hypothetical protein